MNFLGLRTMQLWDIADPFAIFAVDREFADHHFKCGPRKDERLEPIVGTT
jgi:hypothetical protein